jgi:hypothetical protein
MAGDAGNLKMAALKRKSPRLVKAAGDRAPAGRRMAGFAFLGHRPLVRFGMTGAAVPFIRHVGADFMAGRTILGQTGVFSFKSKPGLDGVIKILRVERPDIDIDALMFLVAGFTIPRDLAVNPFFGGDTFGDRLMASEAAPGVDLVSLGVALSAVRLALQRTVRLGQRTWSGTLGLRILAGGAQKGQQKQAAEAGGKSEKPG